MRTTLAVAAVLLSACIPMKNLGPLSSSTTPSEPSQGAGGRVVAEPSEASEASEPESIAERWKVDFSHATAKQSISGTASMKFSGDPVSIASGYVTPWHGSCATASRSERAQPIADAIADRGAQLEGPTRMRFGAGAARVVTLTCADGTTPALELVIGNLGNFAMTCIADVCHTLEAN